MVIQWLGFCVLVTESLGLIPCWGTKIPQSTWCSQTNKKTLKKKKKPSLFLLCTSILLPSLWPSLWSLIWTLSWISCLSLLSFSSRIPSSETYSYADSLCPSCHWYFYVFGKLLMFLYFGEVALYRRHPMHPSSALLSSHPGYMLWEFPIGELCGSFSCSGLIMWVIW